MIGLLVDGDQAAAGLVRRGAHTEALSLPDATVPPTGETVALAEGLVLRVEGDAVASITAHTDRPALKEQLGLS